jgi:GTPase SAR1 family protein
VLVGNSAVGKTSFLQRFCEHHFSSGMAATVGESLVQEGFGAHGRGHGTASRDASVCFAQHGAGRARQSQPSTTMLTSKLILC